MDLYEFNRLSLELRKQLVKQYGTKIAEREVKNFVVTLFYLTDFYAETWYAPDLDEITSVVAFKNKVCLEPYLALITVNKILE